MTTDPRFLPVVPLATASHAKFYPRGPFISIILAQWAVESAYGTRMSGKNNPFGIKATSIDIHFERATRCMTREVIGGRSIYAELWFADYDSLEQAFDQHGHLLTQPWYAECQRARTPMDYAKALVHDHYATAPNYADVLINIMHTNNLYQFDKATTS